MTGYLGDTTLSISRTIDASYATDLGAELHLRRRIDKIAEELGEVHEALGGTVGENPRKGKTHTAADIAYELLDVALASLGAWCHLTGNGLDPHAELTAHANNVETRLLAAVAKNLPLNA